MLSLLAVYLIWSATYLALRFVVQALPPMIMVAVRFIIAGAVLTLVLFLIILVAAFNIVASLTMMVIDKTREVAILKAMGASAPSIASVFRVAGMVIGLLGTLLGVGMGLLTCGIVRRLNYLLDAKVYMIDKLPVQLSPREILWTSGVTVLISLVATLYPSLRAGRMRPVDGLREE